MHSSIAIDSEIICHPLQHNTTTSSLHPISISTNQQAFFCQYSKNSFGSFPTEKGMSRLHPHKYVLLPAKSDPLGVGWRWVCGYTVDQDLSFAGQNLNNSNTGTESTHLQLDKTNAKIITDPVSPSLWDCLGAWLNTIMLCHGAPC